MGTARRGVQFERYDGFEQDERGVLRAGGPLVAWFTDPAGDGDGAYAVSWCWSGVQAASSSTARSTATARMPSTVVAPLGWRA